MGTEPLCRAAVAHCVRQRVCIYSQTSKIDRAEIQAHTKVDKQIHVASNHQHPVPALQSTNKRLSTKHLPIKRVSMGRDSTQHEQHMYVCL